MTPDWELRIFTKLHFPGGGLTAPVPPPQLGSRLGITQLLGPSHLPGWDHGALGDGGRGTSLGSLSRHSWSTRSSGPSSQGNLTPLQPHIQATAKAPPASLGLMEDSWSSWQGLPSPKCRPLLHGASPEEPLGWSSRIQSALSPSAPRRFCRGGLGASGAVMP